MEKLKAIVNAGLFGWQAAAYLVTNYDNGAGRPGQCWPH